MRKFWKRYAPYWHICTSLIFFAWVTMMWVGNVSAYGPRIDTLEGRQHNILLDIASMKQEVHDVHEFLLGSKR